MKTSNKKLYIVARFKLNVYMPVFKLSKETVAFPPADFADSEGLLAEGGDITAQWLLEGYKSGFYLWSHPMQYPKWWTPDPRIVMFPNYLCVPQYLIVEIKKMNINLNFNSGLSRVLRFIQTIENAKEMNNRWLTGKQVCAFLDIEKMGHTFSVEAVLNNQLIGAAFGVRNRRFYFVEYISSSVPFVKELLLIEIVKKAQDENIVFIDLQKETTETTDIGLSEIPRSEYLRILKD